MCVVCTLYRVCHRPENRRKVDSRDIYIHVRLSRGCPYRDQWPCQPPPHPPSLALPPSTLYNVILTHSFTHSLYSHWYCTLYCEHDDDDKKENIKVLQGGGFSPVQSSPPPPTQRPVGRFPHFFGLLFFYYLHKDFILSTHVFLLLLHLLWLPAFIFKRAARIL